MKLFIPILVALSLLTCQNNTKQQPTETSNTTLPPGAKKAWFERELYMVEAGIPREPAKNIREILQTSTGDIWLASIDEGPVRYDGKKFNYYDVPGQMEDRQVDAVLEDKNGMIWFGTDQGVSNFDGTNFLHYGTSDGLKEGWTISLLQDKTGKLWAGTTSGLFYLESNQWKELKLPDLVNPGIPALAEDEEGNLWIGTDTKGIYVYHNPDFSILTKDSGLCNNTVISLQRQPEGDIRIISPYCEPLLGTGNQITRATSLPKGQLRGLLSMASDDQGNLWMGFDFNSVRRYDGSSIKAFTVREGMGLRQIQAILTDKNGLIWFGGLGGLYVFDGKIFKEVSRDGLC